MYRHCIYCAAPLGGNEALEAFPVGAMVAFDPERGRLWAVCARCARWNLAPLEERWEPVEQAERAFADARLRVQRENVGLARLADGTRLVRIGPAAGRELAAWRYGPELRRRRRGYLAGSAGIAAAAAGVWLLGQTVLIGGTLMVYLGWDFRRGLQDRRVIHWVPAAASPGGAAFPLRRGDLGGARLTRSGSGVLAVELPQAGDQPLLLHGEHARSLLSRAMVAVNRGGATQPQVDGAVAALGDQGAEGFVARVAAGRRSLGLPWSVRGTPWLPFTRAVIGEAVEGIRSGLRAARDGGPSTPRHADATRMLTPPEDSLLPAESLALEMALHEARERQALDGELAVLQAAWREAEEIAGIADRLAQPADGRWIAGHA